MKGSVRRPGATGAVFVDLVHVGPGWFAEDILGMLIRLDAVASRGQAGSRALAERRRRARGAGRVSRICTDVVNSIDWPRGF
jgi:hypothetical protein